jgi:hypothetical protein
MIAAMHLFIVGGKAAVIDVEIAEATEALRREQGQV